MHRLRLKLKPLPAIFAALILASLVLLGVGYSDLNHRAQQAEADRAQSAQTVQSVVDDYRQLARDCDEAADCDTNAPTADEVEERGEVTALVGPPGDRGPAGADGTDGSSPTTAEVYAVVSAYCSVNDQCRGIPGLNGLNGSNGADGISVTGAQGPAGADGATGATGATGADGQPPLSWTYQDVLGVEHTCTRTVDFDAANPTYTCS